MSKQGLKRGHEQLEDAGDRASRRQTVGLQRIPLDKIGFWPHNRGGIGFLSAHVHEVATDCMVNKVKRNRYHHVDVVKIPAKFLQEVRSVNATRFKSDPFAPRCPTEGIEYVAMTKTHFCLAHKLCKEGGLSLIHI